MPPATPFPAFFSCSDHVLPSYRFVPCRSFYRRTQLPPLHKHAYNDINHYQGIRKKPKWWIRVQRSGTASPLQTHRPVCPCLGACACALPAPSTFIHADAFIPGHTSTKQARHLHSFPRAASSVTARARAHTCKRPHVSALPHCLFEHRRSLSYWSPADVCAASPACCFWTALHLKGERSERNDDEGTYRATQRRHGDVLGGILPRSAAHPLPLLHSVQG